MELKKTIKINLEKKGKNLICRDLSVLELILGRKCADLHLFKVKRLKGKYIIPIGTIKERIKVLEQRKTKIENYLEIMKQIVR